MRLGSAGDWITASRAMGAGVEGIQDTIRGGTLQQIKRKQVKAYSAAVLNLMNGPEKITANGLMQLAEKFELDPIEASGVLDLIMGWQKKKRDMDRKEALYGSLSESQRIKNSYPNVKVQTAAEKTLQDQKIGAGDFEADNRQGILDRGIAEAKSKIRTRDANIRIAEDDQRFKREKLNAETLNSNRLLGSKSGVTEKKVRDEITNWEIKIEKLRTGKGLDAMQMALAQSNPKISQLIKSRDVSSAIKMIQEHQNWLRKTYLNETSTISPWKQFDKQGL
jgi:hypothetical protein